MMVYKGEASDMSDMTEEQGAAVMAAWGGAQALTNNHPFLSDDNGDFAATPTS